MDGYFIASIPTTEQFVYSFFTVGDIKEEYTDFLHILVVASPIIGCIIGALLSSVVRRIFGGKKYALMFASFLIFFAAFGSFHPEIVCFKGVDQILPEDSTWAILNSFVLARIVGGIGVGITSVLIPMYLTELSLEKDRGGMVTFFFLSCFIGMFVSSLVDSYIYKSHTLHIVSNVYSTMIDSGWRQIYIFEAIPAILMIAVTFVLPPSPRELMMDGRNNEAQQVMMLLYGPIKTRTMIADIAESLQSSMHMSKRVKDNRKIFKLCTLSAFCQQFIGFNTILYYLPRLIKNYFHVNHFSAMNIDKVGRKPLLLVGWSLMLIGLIAIAYIVISGKEFNTLLMLIPLSHYMIGYGISFGSTQSVYILESLPNHIRRRAFTYTQTISWVFTLLSLIIIPPIYLLSKWGTFTITILSTLIYLYVIINMTSETKGLTLEQINRNRSY